MHGLLIYLLCKYLQTLCSLHIAYTYTHYFVILELCYLNHLHLQSFTTKNFLFCVPLLFAPAPTCFSPPDSLKNHLISVNTCCKNTQCSCFKLHLHFCIFLFKMVKYKSAMSRICKMQILLPRKDFAQILPSCYIFQGTVWLLLSVLSQQFSISVLSHII